MQNKSKYPVYSVGQKVRVHTDLHAGQQVPHGVNELMEDFAGKIVTIKHVRFTFQGSQYGYNNYHSYFIEECGGIWSSPMFELEPFSEEEQFWMEVMSNVI